MNENTDSAQSEFRDDPWLTLAEIAEELRVNPATVRLWVRKGQLDATRAGMRKLIVRRSELDRMLGAVNPAGGPAVEDSRVPGASDHGPDASDAPLQSDGPAPAFKPPVGTRESAVRLVEHANDSVQRAFTASALAPPSVGYPDRLRAIADGFEHLGATLLHASRTTEAGWSGRDDWGPGHLPYEVRPGGNRPVRDGLWDRFDEVFRHLGEVMAGDDIVVVGQAFRDASEELFGVADRLAENPSERAERTVG
jgi:excisionase family DNA binding protein